MWQTVLRCAYDVSNETIDERSMGTSQVTCDHTVLKTGEHGAEYVRHATRLAKATGRLKGLRQIIQPPFYKLVRRTSIALTLRSTDWKRDLPNSLH
jgi:hypothetical protein